MSAGIAEAGMRRLGRDRPTPLPVQALDHAAGYLLAAAVIRGLTQRHATGSGWEAHTSLARIATLLLSRPAHHPGVELRSSEPADYGEEIEYTAWGPAHRLLPPLVVDGSLMAWERPAGPLGTSPATW
jgi:hypothetical protein